MLVYTRACGFIGVSKLNEIIIETYLLCASLETNICVQIIVFLYVRTSHIDSIKKSDWLKIVLLYLESSLFLLKSTNFLSFSFPNGGDEV